MRVEPLLLWMFVTVPDFAKFLPETVEHFAENFGGETLRFCIIFKRSCKLFRMIYAVFGFVIEEDFAPQKLLT